MLHRDGELLELENVAAEPATCWQLTGPDSELVRKHASCFFHSHPRGFTWPSEWDLEHQVHQYGGACAIVPLGDEPFWYGDAGVPPLLGRPFRYGATDCYDLIRDQLVSFGVILRNHPRRWGWWLEPGVAMYDELFEAEGLRDVKQGDHMPELEPGDVLLFAVGTEASSHAGVYLGNGRMVHHPNRGRPYDPDSLSRREPIGRWYRFLTRVLRRA